MPRLNPAYPARGRQMQMKVKGSTDFTNVEGVISDDIAAAESSVTPIESYAGIRNVAGPSTPGAISIEMFELPQTVEYADLERAAAGAETREFRFVNKGEGVVYTAPATRLVAWTAASADGSGGVVAFSGTGSLPDFVSAISVGDVIHSGSNYAVIRSIRKSGNAYELVVGGVPGSNGQPSALAAQSAAATFTIERLENYQDISAQVTSFGGASSAAGDPVRTATMTIQPQARVTPPRLNVSGSSLILE